MNAHIVFAHPNLHSYNGQLRNTAIQTLEALGWTVTVSDLYQMPFKASADADDFTEIQHPDFFDLQVEQQAASRLQTYSADIVREHTLLAGADLIVFQFPLWWYSMPGLMKGYIDRVFSMGWAYGGRQVLAGKTVLLSTTTGAPEFAWTPESRGTLIDVFKHLIVGTFGMCGMHVATPFVAYGAKRHSEADREHTKQQLAARITQLAQDVNN